MARTTLPVVLFLLCGCGGSPRYEPEDAAPPDAGPGCRRETTFCEGNAAVHCEDGRERVEPCAAVCEAGLGCIACLPGEASCRDGTSVVCAPDGSGRVETPCEHGAVCDARSGRCGGPCDPRVLGTSYVGCEYYPTVTGNPVPGVFEFAIAIANAGEEETEVVIDGGALPAAVTRTVAAASVHVETLPWVDLLKLCADPVISSCGPRVRAGLIDGGSYRVRSSRPVTVTQFNALEYRVGEVYSYTNDASLLLPYNVLGDRYTVVSREAWGGHPSLFAVTAVEDGTIVTVTTTVPTMADAGAPAFSTGTPTPVELDAGDVLQVLAFSGDLTGSTIESTRPIQVLSGHFCSNVPVASGGCDHLEESTLPVSALGGRYVAAASSEFEIGGRLTVVRIVATEDATSLTFDPPQSAPAFLASAGDFVDVETRDAFEVRSDRKVLVAQYMVGLAAAVVGIGDPSMSLAVPAEQYRTDYLYYVPTTYDASFVNVIAPLTANVTLDGTPVTGLAPIGGSGLGLARVPVAGGRHEARGDAPFGITVYGYARHTAYSYPGGLNLDPILLE